MKILSIVQTHFARDRQGEDMITAFEGRFSVAMDQHKKRINKVLKQLEGNPGVVKFLRTTLYKAAEAFHIHSAAVAKQYGSAVIHQGESSETRLKEFSKSIIAELEATIQAEKLDATEELNLEKIDPEWKLMQQKFEKEDHGKSQDEKDVHNMLSHFDSKIKRLDQPVLSASDIAEAEALLVVGEKKAMRIDFKHLEDKIKGFYQRAGVPVPESATKGNVLKGFRELINEAKFRVGSEPAIKKSLAKWEKGDSTDTELMLQIEHGVKTGEVNPEWLNGKHADESVMLAVGHEDHASKGNSTLAQDLPTEWIHKEAMKLELRRDKQEASDRDAKMKEFQRLSDAVTNGVSNGDKEERRLRGAV